MRSDVCNEDMYTLKLFIIDLTHFVLYSTKCLRSGFSLSPSPSSNSQKFHSLPHNTLKGSHIDAFYMVISSPKSPFPWDIRVSHSLASVNLCREREELFECGESKDRFGKGSDDGCEKGSVAISSGSRKLPFPRRRRFLTC